MTAYSVYRQDDEPEPPSAARRPALCAPTYRRSGGAAAALAAGATVSDREAADDSAVPVVLQLPDLSVLDDETPWHLALGGRAAVLGRHNPRGIVRTVVDLVAQEEPRRRRSTKRRAGRATRPRLPPAIKPTIRPR